MSREPDQNIVDAMILAIVLAGISLLVVTCVIASVIILALP